MNLLEAAQPAADHVRSLPRESVFRIVAHHDADGVASAAVAVRALQRLGRSFHVRFTYEQDPRAYLAQETQAGDCHLFLDIGASLLPALQQFHGSVLVLDHHRPPAPPPTRPSLIILNPHDHGMDGMREACGGTTTLAWALALDERNWDLAPHALVGAHADRQDRGGLKGWNDFVLKESLRRGHVQLRPRLAFDDAPLRDLLTWPPEGLRGLLPAGEEAAAEFLRAYGLPPEATVHELGDPEQEVLASALALSLLRHERPPEALGRLVESVPTSPAHRGLPLPRLVNYLDAATREGEPGLALSFVLGDETVRTDLERILSTFHAKIRSGVRAAVSQAPRELAHARVFPVEEAPYLGTLCGLAADSIFSNDKATVTYAASGDRTIVSSRANPTLLAAGVDLGRALAKAAASVDGVGGGHAIAAGATVPARAFELFLTRLDEELANQRGSEGSP